MTKKAAAQLTACLAELPTERLVEMVISQAEHDVELRTQLLLEAASSGGGPLDVSSYRRSFADALKSGSANRRDYARTSGPWARAVGSGRGGRGRSDRLSAPGSPLRR
jgi:hypothetical protein